MHLKTSFVVTCLAAFAVGTPLIHRELPADAVAAAPRPDFQEAVIVPRKLGRRRKTKCSGQGGVTVTNINTVTAGIPGVVNPEIDATADTSSATALDTSIAVAVTETSSDLEIASATSSEALDSSTAVAAPDTSFSTVVAGTSFDVVPTSTAADGLGESSSASPVDASSSIDATNTIIPAVSTDVSTATVPEITNAPSDVPAANPSSAVPVSRAGGILDPTAVAESHEFDTTAERPVESVNIKAPDGRCLFIDPTAGDFRENLIPVQLVECEDVENQKFDIVTKGKHNDGTAGKALLVSVLTNGCISFDPRRPAGDTVTLFSCGGRANGEGQTDQAQLYPFDGTNNIVLAAASGNNETCVVAGTERLDSGPCSNGDDQVFELVGVL